MEQMQKGTTLEDCGTAEFLSTAPQGGVASLMLLPNKLQEIVIEAVLKTKPARCTDIWYEDKTSGTVFVMRLGMQWHLNETASYLWLSIGEQTETIVNKFCEKYGNEDEKDIAASVVEFLLNAHSFGLIELYPEPVLEKLE